VVRSSLLLIVGSGPVDDRKGKRPSLDQKCILVYKIIIAFPEVQDTSEPSCTVCIDVFLVFPRKRDRFQK